MCFPSQHNKSLLPIITPTSETSLSYIYRTSNVPFFSQSPQIHFNNINNINNNMCINSTESTITRRPLRVSERKQRPRRSKFQVYRLTCSRKSGEEKVEKNMELMNLKLFLENQTIIEENKKLRKKANLLHQENKALISEFQHKFPDKQHLISTSLLHKQ